LNVVPRVPRGRRSSTGKATKSVTNSHFLPENLGSMTLARAFIGADV